MRPDQRVRLADLSEKLAEVVLDEADPDTWPAPGVPVGAMTKEERGDRYWCKKNAAATLMLLGKVEGMLATDKPPAAPGDDERDTDSAIAKAEAEAARLLDQVTGQARKEAFDTRVHGSKR